jgi:hypothetical protein
MNAKDFLGTFQWNDIPSCQDLDLPIRLSMDRKILGQVVPLTMRPFSRHLRPCLDSKVCLPNSLCRIPIPRHIKMPAHIWSTKYR